MCAPLGVALSDWIPILTTDIATVTLAHDATESLGLTAVLVKPARHPKNYFLQSWEGTRI